MVKVISKSEINELDKFNIVESRKENIEINKLVKPEKKPPMIKAPRAVRMPKPAPKVSKAELEALMMPRAPPPPRYTEYKHSLSNTIDTALSKIETNSNLQGGLIDRIKSSRDVQTIVKDRLFEMIDPVGNNDILALVMTVGSFYIENKLT